ncbi:hypothetical protein HJC23_013157 [Cyclotella cryptica]|uniref:Domain of unknown function at the cortex 1 domain-containing protein n=1 Tax=Cyclotella cryptica TaxID=29204 RepID=A0ABD3QNL4_9STRA
MTSPRKTTASAASNLSQTSQHSFDSIEDHNDIPHPLSHRDAIRLAQKMNTGLQRHTKDRMYRFKSYKSCFKHSHALSWALQNIDADERVAVGRLNELIDWGLVSHVVDPEKRFRVNECRTLYFRIVQGALNEEQLMQDEYGERDVVNDSSVNNGKQVTDISSSAISRVMSDKMHEMQAKLDGIDHVLAQTVQELNAANGQLELMNQKVCTLVSQQISLFTVVFLLFVYVILAVAPSSVLNNKWFNQPGILAAFLMMLLGRCSFIFINARSLLDYTRVVPEEVTDEESSAGESTPSSIMKPHTKPPSFTRAVSERFGTIVSKKSSNSLVAAREKSIILMRESYSLPDIETWPNRPLLICVNTPVSINIKVPTYGLGPCPLGKPFEFSSDLFEGTCLIRIKGSRSDDIPADTEYFSGRKRIFQCVVQGRFKEDGLRVSDVLTGHEFSRPLKNLPHPWILRTASNFIGRVAPGSNVVVHTDQPLVEAILAGTSQAVRGGKFPDLLPAWSSKHCLAPSSEVTFDNNHSSKSTHQQMNQGTNQASSHVIFKRTVLYLEESLPKAETTAFRRHVAKEFSPIQKRPDGTNSTPKQRTLLNSIRICLMRLVTR